MTYRFKPLSELYWGVLIAMATVLLTDLVGLTVEHLNDWRPWALALAVACVRAGAGAAIDYIRRSVTDQSSLPQAILEEILALSPNDRAMLAEELERLGKPS